MNVSPSMYLPFSNWSLKPKLGEPARGYFLRLVANEGHYSASVYGNEVGINGRCLLAEETLDTLLKLPISDEHKAAVRFYSPQADGAYYDLGGQRLRKRQMTFSTRRFCRACLADSPHHRVWWDICAFRACPEHGTPIEDTDAAGQPVGWWWADVACDTNGNPLAEWAPSQADQHDRTLEAFILERLGVKPATEWPILQQYSLYEIIEVSEFLGRWLGNEHRTDPPSETRSNQSAGMAALAGTREDLVVTLRSWFVEHVSPALRKKGKTVGMGWAHIAIVNYLHTYPSSTLWKELREAINEAFEPIGRRGKRKFRETADFYTERALSKFADSIDVRLDALIPLARHVGVVRNLAKPWELSTTDEGILKAAIADLVPTAEVSCILAVESWAWQSLVGTGRLAVFAHFSLGRMYLRTDVERLLGNVLSMASQTAQGTTVSLRTYARRHALSIGDVVAMILEDCLVIVRENNTRPGLRAIRVLAHNRTKASVV
ncbi:TniQ family protein [Agrobacterium sp. NPDC089420]|uniref:TniQ family protein n=1 Tax=Agrobacterium sp. NPDC089420 TaxID=3363918 RepID=UPI003850F69C